MIILAADVYIFQDINNPNNTNRPYSYPIVVSSSIRDDDRVSFYYWFSYMKTSINIDIQFGFWPIPGSGSDVAARKLDQEASWQTITEY